MAEDTVDELVDHLDGLPRSARRCRTARLRLRGARDGDAERAPGRPVTSPAGTAPRPREVHALIDADPSLGEPLVPGLPYLRAEAVHAARHEMARTVDDVLARRTAPGSRPGTLGGRGRRRSASSSRASSGWTDEETDRQVAAYVALVEAERAAPGLSPTVDGRAVAP